jgi:hypothetical protein
MKNYLLICFFILVFPVLLFVLSCLQDDESNDNGTLDSTAPGIALFGPTNNSVDVPPDCIIAVTFTVEMDTTATESAFSLNNGTGNALGAFSWQGKTMVFTPLNEMDYATTYSIVIETMAQDKEGVQLAEPVTSVFTTGSPPLSPPGLTNLSFTLDEVNDDPLWVKTGTGSIIPVSDAVDGPLCITRSDYDISGARNFMIEAVVSSLLPGSPGEAGARIWVKVHSELCVTDFQYQFIQIRLMKETNNNNNFIGLYDNSGNLAQMDGGGDAKIILRWDTASPRYRIRLMRLGDEIIMQAEPSDVWDNDALCQSISVPLNTTNFPPLVGPPNTNEIGFGNAMAAGNMTSTWESIHITTANNNTTTLPYWPVSPPVPILILEDNGNLPGIYFYAYCSGRPYLLSDIFTPHLLVNGLDYTKDPKTNPDNEFYNFSGISPGEQADGYVVITDVSGRSTAGSCAYIIVP